MNKIKVVCPRGSKIPEFMTLLRTKKKDMYGSKML